MIYYSNRHSESVIFWRMSSEWSGQDLISLREKPQACLLLCLFVLGYDPSLYSAAAALFCPDFFAAMNVAGECGGGRRNSHSLGSSCICSTPFSESPPPHMEKGMFCLWNTALSGLCTPSLSSRHSGTQRCCTMWRLELRVHSSACQGPLFAFIFSQNPSGLTSGAIWAKSRAMLQIPPTKSIFPSPLGKKLRTALL